MIMTGSGAEEANLHLAGIVLHDSPTAAVSMSFGAVSSSEAPLLPLWSEKVREEALQEQVVRSKLWG